MPETRSLTPDGPGLTEQLVAYLDNELGPEDSREIEQLLASSAEVRQELAQLRNSWDMLDRLPRTATDKTVVRTTLQMLAVQEQETVERHELSAPARRRWRVAIASLGALLLLVAGFALGRSLLTDRNDRLLDDLTLIRQLDQYRQIEDIDFLRSLHDSGLLAPEPQPAEADDARP